MTAKEYMKQAQRLLRRIDRKQKEADALRQKLSFPKSPAYSDLPKPVSPESHAVESGVSQIGRNPRCDRLHWRQVLCL